MGDFEMSIHGGDFAGDLLPDRGWERMSVVVTAPRGCLGDWRHFDRVDDRLGRLAC